MFNRNDIIWAYLLAEKQFENFHEMREKGRIRENSNKRRVCKMKLSGEAYIQVAHMFGSNYLPINKITSKPITDNAKRIYIDLVRKCGITKEEDIELLLLGWGKHGYMR